MRRCSYWKGERRGETDRLRGNGQDRTACLAERGGSGSRRHGLRALAAQEAVVRASSIDWTIVRAAILHDGPASNNVTARGSGTIGSPAHGPWLRRRPERCADRSVAARASVALARGVPGCGARERRIDPWGGSGDPGGRRGRRTSEPERSHEAGHRGVGGSPRGHVSCLAAGSGTSRGTRRRRVGRRARDLRASSRQHGPVRPFPQCGGGGGAVRAAGRSGRVRAGDGCTRGPEADPSRLRI